jgi:hypothetical protein
MVYRRVTVTNIDSTHDKNAKDSFYSKLGNGACFGTYIYHNGYWYFDTVYSLWYCIKTSAIAIKLFPLASIVFGFVLFSHTIREELVYQKV